MKQRLGMMYERERARALSPECISNDFPPSRTFLTTFYLQSATKEITISKQYAAKIIDVSRDLHTTGRLKISKIGLKSCR